MSAPEHKLMRNLATDKNDRAARDLYRAYSGELFGFAVRRLRDRQGAEEVVQDVFTRAWRHAGDFDPEISSVRTWLSGIPRNAIIPHERKRGRRLPVAPGETDEPVR